MDKLEQLLKRIRRRVDINLRETGFHVGPFVRDLVPMEQYNKFYAFYGLTSDQPVYFKFSNSSLAGSYFLGRCEVDHSVIYKCDIRGDELKKRGDSFEVDGVSVPVHADETVIIKDSFLVKSLVHNYSHDPENLEEFTIKNTTSMPFANIHGSPVEGSFLGAFSTIDLTRVIDCVIGRYAYVQAGELAHNFVDTGQVLIRSADEFEFAYRMPERRLNRYIYTMPGQPVKGVFFEFIEAHQHFFEEVFSSVEAAEVAVSPGSYVSKYAALAGHTDIRANVLIAQRCLVKDSYMGRGANAQENCFIVNSRLEGHDVTAHGGKLINAHLGDRVFVGFNAFLRGCPDNRLEVGENCVIMPHTIIDTDGPLAIPAEHLVWGCIHDEEDLAEHSLPFEELVAIEDKFEMGEMRFTGSGKRFLEAFLHRIDHILEANGAYFDGREGRRGHAQTSQQIAYNIIQPYPDGENQGLYPTMVISPPDYAML